MSVWIAYYVPTYITGGIAEYNGFTGRNGVFRLFTDTMVENTTDDSHNALLGYDLVFFRNGSQSRPGLLCGTQCYSVFSCVY